MTVQVPGYDVAHLLGYGATGEVWLAREVATGEAVALKRLRCGGGMRERDRVRREAAVLAALEHPHLVRLRTVVTLADELVLVLDHAAGGSLSALMGARGTLLPGEVVTIATPLAQALAAVHARGVVHGDVSPANVLFTADGRPLLADLGVARLLGEPVGVPEGTPEFADPAVVAGAPPDASTDVFGLAAVCFAALTGVPPVAGGGPAPLHRLAADVPGELVDVIHAAMAPDPVDRPTAAELASALFDACEAEPVRLVAVGSVEQAEEGLAEVSLAEAADIGESSVTRQLRTPASPPEPIEAPSRLRALLQAIARPARRDFARGARPAPAELPSWAQRPPAAASAGPAARRRGGRATTCGAGARAEPVGAAPGVVAVWALGGIALLALAAAGGVLWARSGEAGVAAGVAALPSTAESPGLPSPRLAGSRTAQPGRSPARLPAPAADWARVLGDLDRARSVAFARGRPDQLARVYAPRSPAGRRDLAALAALTRTGRHTPDLRLTVRSARWQRGDVTKGPVELRVVDRLAAYTIRDAGGSVLEQRPGRGDGRWVVTVVRVEGRWRVWDVVRTP